MKHSQDISSFDNKVNEESTILMENDKEQKMMKFRCSSYIKSKGLLVKGEYENHYSESRNPIVIFIDVQTGEISGNR